MFKYCAYDAEDFPECAFGVCVLVGSARHDGGLERPILTDKFRVAVACELTPVVRVELLDGHAAVAGHVGAV